MAADDEGMLDPDTRRSIASGRRTIGDILGAAQQKGRRIFIVFVIGLLGTVYAMRVWIWPILKRDLLARGADVVVITPFDVILLQAKIGIFVGILMSIPFLLYYAREPLKRRGWYPEEGVATWKLGTIGILALVLFVAGVTYSYNIFFPVMFDFLAHNAISAGLAPTYSIVDWTQFILVLGLSFGLAAQLPLVMTALSYAEIVPYETFRDKWKYAIVAMFGFGALFSPPDPFTQVMWAGPLVILYGFSLYLARLAVGLKRGTSPRELVGDLISNLNKVAAGFVLAAGLTYWFLTGGLGFVNRRLLPQIPAGYRPEPVTLAPVLPFEGMTEVLVAAAIVGGVVALLLVFYYARPRVEPAEGRFGDPTAIDLDDLDVNGVRAAPPEVFAELDEESVLTHARTAMDSDQPEKAEAILERYDEAEEQRQEADEDGQEEATSGPMTRATTGIVDAFTEEETTEEDVGGYYYDLAFIFDSLRSKAFRLFFVFIAVLAGVFGFLYSGGIGAIKRDFISRLPAVVRPEEVNVITLHPVEALVFEVKIATLLGAVALLPMLLYYAWPALRDRGLARGNRNVFFGWAGAIFGGLLVGSAVGYTYIAPAVVSYFVWDALQADMVIVYRVSNFFWLVFFTTVGIGLWLDIPITMVLFHRAGIATYQAMRERWRVVTLAVLAFAAIFTPASVLSMILIAIPIMFGYGVGLGILWVYTLGGRRTPRPAAG